LHGTIRHEPAQALKRVAWDLDGTALPAVLWEGVRSHAILARLAPREGDVLLRYGGEEFLAVLPAASADDLRRVGERLRRAVEGSVLADEEKSIRVTVSVGGKSYPNQMVETEDMVVQFAEEALYRAKESGRNRVEITR